MKFIRSIAELVWEKLLILAGSVFVLLPLSPMNMPSMYRDSGVFLYAGWRILNGELPYRDIWDHKPPIIYYLDALGLAITRNSRWGVWLLELLCLVTAAYLGYALVKKAMGTLPAVYSLTAWLVSLTYVIQGGNLTTEYTLPLQFAALWLAYDLNRTENSGWRWFLLGILGAAAFFTKQTTIGIWAAILLYTAFSRLKDRQVSRWITEMWRFFAGFITICTGWILFFAIQGGLAQFWDAAFRFNYIYSFILDAGTLTRMEHFLMGIRLLTRTGLFQTALVGYGLGLIFFRYKKSIIGGWQMLFWIGVIDLPLELLLINSSGRDLGHYYMTLLPVLTIFTGFSMQVILSYLSSREIPFSAQKMFTGIVVGVLLWSCSGDYYDQVMAYRKVQDEEAVQYIQSISSPDQSVLLWGSAASINFQAQRRSPTRFVYQAPLYIKEYADEKMVLEFLDEIIEQRPQFIVETYSPSTPMFQFPVVSEEIQTKVGYLKSHYQKAGHIDKWIVYEYREDPVSQ